MSIPTEDELLKQRMRQKRRKMMAIFAVLVVALVTLGVITQRNYWLAQITPTGLSPIDSANQTRVAMGLSPVASFTDTPDATERFKTLVATLVNSLTPSETNVPPPSFTAHPTNTFIPTNSPQPTVAGAITAAAFFAGQTQVAAKQATLTPGVNNTAVVQTNVAQLVTSPTPTLTDTPRPTNTAIPTSTFRPTVAGAQTAENNLAVLTQAAGKMPTLTPGLNDTQVVETGVAQLVTSLTPTPSRTPIPTSTPILGPGTLALTLVNGVLVTKGVVTIAPGLSNDQLAMGTAHAMLTADRFRGTLTPTPTPSMTPTCTPKPPVGDKTPTSTRTPTTTKTPSNTPSPTLTPTLAPLQDTATVTPTATQPWGGCG